MRIVPLSSDIAPLQNVLIARAYMLFPEDEEKQGAFLKASNALVELSRLREAAPDDGQITLSCQQFDEAKVGLDYLIKTKAELERREDMGKRAGSMAANLVYLSDYYRCTKSKKSPSLTDVYDIMIGWAAEYQNESGVNLAHNRTSLNAAWQQFSPVAHLWMAEILVEGAITKGFVGGASTDEGVAKRMDIFLAAAKYTLGILVNIIPHGRKEPVVNIEQLYWLTPELNDGVGPFVQAPPSFDASTLKGMREFITRYKGAKALGKKSQRKKIPS